MLVQNTCWLRVQLLTLIRLRGSHFLNGCIEVLCCVVLWDIVVSLIDGVGAMYVCILLIPPN